MKGAVLIALSHYIIKAHREKERVSSHTGLDGALQLMASLQLSKHIHCLFFYQVRSLIIKLNKNVSTSMIRVVISRRCGRA